MQGNETISGRDQKYLSKIFQKECGLCGKPYHYLIDLLAGP